MAADFTTLTTDLTAAKAEIATLAAKVATDATAVAALATTALGGEADNDRYARLRELLLSTIGQLAADCSVLDGRCRVNQQTLVADFQSLRSANAITPAAVPLHDIAGSKI
jgi:hypothetical protein